MADPKASQRRSKSVRASSKTEAKSAAVKAVKPVSRGVPAPVHPVVKPYSAKTELAEEKTADSDASSQMMPDMLKKPELLEKLSATTGLPKSRIRPVMEAMLDILGEAVAQDRALQLPPLGKVKPLRSKLEGAARITHVKIRQILSKGDADTS